MPTESRFDDLDLREEPATKSGPSDWTTPACTVSAPCTETCNHGCTSEC